MSKSFKVTLFFKEIDSHDESGRNIKVKVDRVKEEHNQPGAEVPVYQTTKERFFEAAVFHDPLNYGFLFDGCPLIIKGIQKVELLKEKK